mmetsp:Transcript_16798/g.32749  ORF Transcript_16798/g.32749 Transcript_16798/m.32749 type:complete len:472 (-) Transcript_16798:519-1934(-)|eukprot:CAMPEP_0171516642 /NCGR_PEP_ID=MMETSP0959-20130129/4161_1 /TAXON_ID=87120 /ORGANISM="Aurantiochytrium limacinum, Strain ATCCMYA-1381" /LENGTH=471 /DNA_ID=CAMNT_0012055397 /DNA_START=104 /DNA_END=1519 /DNA_ORIENTATION=+
MEELEEELRVCEERVDAGFCGILGELDALINAVSECKAALRAEAEDCTSEEADSISHGSNNNTATQTQRNAVARGQKRKLALANLNSQVDQTSSVTNVRSQNKSIHAALNRLGKAIDKVLSPEDIEIFRRATKENKEDEEIIAKLLTQAIVFHFLHAGQIDLARDLAEETGEPLDSYVMQDFVEMNTVIQSLSGHAQARHGNSTRDVENPTVDITIALKWAKSHSQKLEETSSSLLFELHKLHYLQLVANGDVSNAVLYARNEFAVYSEARYRDVQSLMGKLVFLEPGLVKEQQKVVLDIFRADASSVYGISSGSPLRVALAAGQQCIEKLRKYFRVVMARRALNAGSGDSAHDTSYPPGLSAAGGTRRANRAHQVSTTQPPSSSSEEVAWVDMDQLPVHVELDSQFDFHSVIICPVTKERTTAENKPILLDCGHVIAKASLDRIVKPTMHFKCPTCQVEQSVRAVMEIHI